MNPSNSPNVYERFIEESEALTIKADESAVAVVGRLTRAAKRAQMVVDGELPPVSERGPQQYEEHMNNETYKRRSVLWYECAHGHQFGVVVETVGPERKIQCPGCGTVTIKTFQSHPIQQTIPLPIAANTR